MAPPSAGGHIIMCMKMTSKLDFGRKCGLSLPNYAVVSDWLTLSSKNLESRTGTKKKTSCKMAFCGQPGERSQADASATCTEPAPKVVVASVISELI